MGLRIRIARPDDLLSLEVECSNLRLDQDDTVRAALVPEQAGEPAFLTLYVSAADTCRAGLPGPAGVWRTACPWPRSPARGRKRRPGRTRPRFADAPAIGHTAMSASHRKQIVALTSMLSALGGWLKCRGQWERLDRAA